MAANPEFKKFEADLTGMLAPALTGIDIHVEHGKRWNRPSVTFRWSGFAGLLPEERFHRLVALIPEDFCRDRLAGFVWLELTPEETVEAHLQLPRSEDVAAREDEIYHGLQVAAFFEALDAALGTVPERKCPGDFSTLAKVLTEKQFTSTQVRDVKLTFIGQGVYCDCQALLAASRVPARSGAQRT